MTDITPTTENADSMESRIRKANLLFLGRSTCDVLLRQFPDCTGNPVCLLRGEDWASLLVIQR